MPTTNTWLRYRARRVPAWRTLGLASSIIQLALLPAYFWFASQLLRGGDVPLLQVQILRGVYTFTGLFAVAFIVYAIQGRKREHPTRVDHWFLNLGVLAVIFAPAVIASANQLSHGSIVVFLMGSVYAMVISYARPIVFVSANLIAMVSIVVAATLLQGNPTTAASAIVNVLLIGGASAILYAYVDRFRYRDFMRREQLEDLLQVRDTLLRAIGHDLRSPLVNVRRVARVLESDEPLESDRKQLANELDAISHRYGLVLDNLTSLGLQASRKPGAMGGPASLLETFEKVLELHSFDASRKDIALESNLEDDLLVNADRDLLVAALSNLVANAIKFTPSGGHVRLDAVLTHNHVTLRVSDTGIGISPTIHTHIQQGTPTPPTTGTDGEQGLGIGLTVVRNLLKTHNTTLTLQPNTPHGTTAQFTIPRYRSTLHA